MFKSTTARETSIEKKKKGVGGKTLHRERGDRCRRVTGTVRCRETQREERERDVSRDLEKELKI